MIRYALKCAEDHRFESWFQSASAFDTLSRGGHVACPVCGRTDVEKAIMAPRVATADKGEPAPPQETAKRPLSGPAHPGRTDAAQAARPYREEFDLCRQSLRRRGPRDACWRQGRDRHPRRGHARRRRARWSRMACRSCRCRFRSPARATDAALARRDHAQRRQFLEIPRVAFGFQLATEAATWRAMASGVMPSRRSLSTMDLPLGPSGCVKRSASSPS
jgi:hypothetical protein